ncbi:MAG: DUF2231 domain-containing protein [Anaerolineae bacterium]|nr:DUF2231 domain-containing protein [Anaerolineae bacterium]
MFLLHPRLIHFPIAWTLLGIACIAVGLLWPRAGERWLWAGRWLLLGGWLSALVAGIAGVVDQSQAADLPAVREAINPHITAGIALLIVLGLALYWPLKDKQLFVASGKRLAYLALLLLVALLVLLEGWLGGKLVYELGVGVRGW